MLYKETTKGMESILLALPLLLITIAAGLIVCSAELTPKNRQLLDSGLQTDHSDPPFYKSGNTTNITLTIIVTQIASKQNYMDLEIAFYSYQVWRDLRYYYLGIPSKMDDTQVVQPKYYKNVWTPDINLENVRLSETSPADRFVWLFPNGTLVNGLRQTATLQCEFTHLLFPLAHYDCQMLFRIHAYRNKELRLNWHSTSPVSFTSEYKEVDFTLSSWDTYDCDVDETAVLDSSCLQLTLHIRRDFSKHSFRLYMPSVFVVFVGWLSFWINRNDVSARVKLGTLCLLAMITDDVGIQFLVPAIQTLHVMEIWFIVNLAFVVVVMVEFTFVHAVDCYQKKNTECYGNKNQANVVLLNVIDKSTTKADINADEINEDPNTQSNHGAMCHKVIMSIRTGIVEKVMRWLYAVFYAAFLILYWIYFLNSKL